MYKSVIEQGMRIDWDVPIEMDDGLVLRADVYRPVKKGRYPVILTHGPYGKWLAFQDGYVDQWRMMSEEHPDVTVRFVEPLPMLGGGGSGEVGARRVRLRTRGLPRLRAVSRISRSLFGAGGEGLLQLHRMGGRSSPGATGRSDSTGSPTMPPSSGRWRP